MSTHYWGSIRITLKDGIVKPGTKLYVIGSEGDMVWSYWGATKPATFIKESVPLVFPSLVFGEGIGMPPSVHFSVHVARLAPKDSRADWQVGQGLLSLVHAGENKANINDKHTGDTIGTIYLTCLTYECKFDSVVQDQWLSFSAMAVKLDRMDSGIGAKSDPYFIMHVKYGSNKLPIYQSQFQRKTLEPNWGTVVLPKLAMGGLDENHELIFDVYDWDKNSDMGGDDFIGTFTTTVANIMAKKSCAIYNHEKKQKKSSYVDSGTFLFSDPKVVDFKTNMAQDRLNGNLKVKVNLVGTLSKPNPAKASTEFSIGKCIQSIFENARYYDSASDMRLSGIHASNSGKVQRIPDQDTFFGSPGSDPQKAFEAENAKNEFQACTLIAPVIDSCTVQAILEAKENPAIYNVFYIFVYDQIDDLDACLTSLANSSNHPVSFVFIGVGDALKSDWRTLEQFNPSVFGLASSERWAARDNIRFVPFSGSEEPHGANAATAGVPSQVREYCIAQVDKQKGAMAGYKPLLK